MYLDIPHLRKWLAVVRIGNHVQTALNEGRPIVALESAVFTHGLPATVSLMLARELEALLQSRGVTPATVAVIEGKLVIGTTARELENLVDLASRRAQARITGQPEPVAKLTARDLGPFLGRAKQGNASFPKYGGTTVGATLVACRLIGIRVFATGGLGGVHRFPKPYDISNDLPQLAVSPVIVVSSGIKAILHVEMTLEYLETLGVPVIGYQTDTFPVFYARAYRPKGETEPLRVPIRADTPQEVVHMALTHWALDTKSGLLVAVPPPERVAIPWETLEGWLEQAFEEARQANLRGPAVTPFLLQRLHELSGGRTLEVNLDILRQNVKVARDIARALYQTQAHYLQARAHPSQNR